MDEVARRDQKVFIQELLNPGQIILMLLLGGLTVPFLLLARSGDTFLPMFAFLLVAIGAHVFLAWSRSKRRRFISQRFAQHWMACEERLQRFRSAIKQSRKNNIASFEELPKTIESVAQSIYSALRRADLIAAEVVNSEAFVANHKPPIVTMATGDRQAQELYRVADRNVAEYRQQFANVTAGVQRTEAQVAVFITTLDTLRLKMLGYRLTGRKPELSSHEFLFAISEAKLQLASIDQALEELEQGPWPQMIATVPPPTPRTTSDEAEELRRTIGGLD